MTQPADTLLTQDSLATELETFIRARFRVMDDDPGFHRDTDLWEEGYVDSAGAVEVLAFLEGALGRRLSEDVLFEPDFVTISGMVRLALGVPA